MRAKRPHNVENASGSGFTLIELMVVVLLIGISSAMVVPRLAGSLPGVKIKSSARNVAASLRYARSQAVSYQIPFAVTIDPEQQRLSVAPTRTWTTDPQSVKRLEPKYYQPPPNIRIIQDTEHSKIPMDQQVVILFYASGASSGGKISLLDHRQQQYVVDVDTITGRISVEQL